VRSDEVSRAVENRAGKIGVDLVEVAMSCLVTVTREGMQKLNILFGDEPRSA